jgi:hypothetical protein
MIVTTQTRQQKSVTPLQAEVRAYIISLYLFTSYYYYRLYCYHHYIILSSEVTWHYITPVLLYHILTYRVTLITANYQLDDCGSIPTKANSSWNSKSLSAPSLI